MANYTITTEVDIKNSVSGGSAILFPPGSANAVSLITPSLSSNINFSLPNNAGTNGNFLQVVTPGNFSWVSPPSASSSNISLPLNISYTYASNAIVMFPAIGETLPAIAAAFAVISVGRYLFSGTSIASPKRCSVIATTNISSMDIRIIDVTNSSNVICFMTLNVGTTVLTSTSTFTNLPLNQAVFEIQARAGAANSSTIFNLLLE